MLALHAGQDRLVPKSHAERLHAWAGSEDKRSVLFADHDYNTLLSANVARYLADLHALLKWVLG